MAHESEYLRTNTKSITKNHYRFEYYNKCQQYRKDKVGEYENMYRNCMKCKKVANYHYYICIYLYKYELDINIAIVFLVLCVW